MTRRTLNSTKLSRSTEKEECKLTTAPNIKPDLRDERKDDTNNESSDDDDIEEIKLKHADLQQMKPGKDDDADDGADDKQQRPANDEETYRMANVMGECNGLDVLLERLSCVRDIHGEGRPLLGALVKLLSFCVKVQTNRALLISPELDAVQRLLVALKLCLEVNFLFLFFSCGK